MNTKLPYSITHPSETHLGGLQELWTEAFGDTIHLIKSFFDTAYSPKRCLAAILGTEVIGALYWFDCEYQGTKLAYLYAVATAKKYRGMGICRKLIDECHCQLSAHGYTGVLLVPGNEDLYSFYQRMGYEVCSYVREFSCTAENGEIRLHTITVGEYTRLRRQFLPENAVIQEGEKLNFLQTFAQFYVGCDCPDTSLQILLAVNPLIDSTLGKNNDFFLLASYQEKNILHGIELLGNPTHASRIVHELGCSNGIFCTPIVSRTQENHPTSYAPSTLETESPFAMYHSLNNESIEFPIYFGIAFD